MQLRTLRTQDGLKVVQAPDGHSFIFQDMEIMEWSVSSVLTGKDYPVLYGKYYDPKIIVDIGAHVGSAARYFASIFPNAQIFSYEPHPMSFLLLERNVECIKNNVHIHNAGLGDKDEKLKLYDGVVNTMQASLTKNEENLENFFEVNIIKATDALKEHDIKKIDILKIDTEGAEMPILLDIKEFLDDTDYILIEYHSEEDRLKIDALLSEKKVLYDAHIHEPDRGSLAYMDRQLMNDVRSKHNIHHYAFPK